MDMNIFQHPLIENPSHLDDTDYALIKIIQRGLPICSRPYQFIAAQIGSTETQVIERLQHLQQNGCIKRMGVIVKHRKLGYRANAMVVWDIPDDQVQATGQCFSQFEFITLCYRRPRHLPEWPYNLFCMIHGHSREDVLQQLSFMVEQCQLDDYTHQVLFSNRCFKQRGAIYQPDTVNNKQAITA